MKLFCEILLIALSASIVSCSASKNLVPEDKATAVASYPCAEKGISDAEFFRACADATSSNISLAREKAVAKAKSSLGKTIVDKVLVAVEQENVSDKEIFLKDIGVVSNKAIDIVLKDISPVCEKYSETNGRYTAYIAVEINRQTVIDKICELATRQINDFDGNMFKNIFNQ
ncbi:MAG: hypothetical protein IIU33_00875 [Bacteroidales bacterium]|nr:hypothetical protein [Bacteroidales bacterium]